MMSGCRRSIRAASTVYSPMPASPSGRMAVDDEWRGFEWDDKALRKGAGSAERREMAVFSAVATRNREIYTDLTDRDAPPQCTPPHPC